MQMHNRFLELIDSVEGSHRYGGEDKSERLPAALPDQASGGPDRELRHDGAGQ